MNKKVYMPGGVVERANNRLMRDGIKSSGPWQACRSCDSLSVSVKYRGENILQTLSKSKIKEAFEKSVKSVSNAAKL